MQKTFMKKLIKKNILVHKLSTENNELYGSVKPTEISKLILELDKLRNKTFNDTTCRKKLNL